MSILKFEQKRRARWREGNGSLEIGSSLLKSIRLVADGIEIGHVTLRIRSDNEKNN